MPERVFLVAHMVSPERLKVGVGTDGPRTHAVWRGEHGEPPASEPTKATPTEPTTHYWLGVAGRRQHYYLATVGP